MANVNLSSYQKDIINEVVNGKNPFVTEGVAGCGKTFTMTMAIDAYMKAYPRKKVGFACFNHDMAKELKEKTAYLGRNVTASTLHSLGYSAISKFYGTTPNGQRMRIIVKNLKWNCIVRDDFASGKLSKVLTIDCEDERMKAQYKNNVVRWLNFCRMNLLTENDTTEIAQLAETYKINPIADEYDAVRRYLKVVYNLHVGDEIDYLDMITFGALNSQYVYKFDLMIIDECQDLNKAQHQLMLNLTNTRFGGKWVAIGDPHQAINGFAGSMNDSFAKLVEMANGRILPLTVNYRCGSNIIKLAQGLVSTITAHEGAIEGIVRHDTKLDAVEGGDFILCRKTAPLVQLCYKYIACGKTAIVRGRDIGKNLKAYIKNSKVKTINALYTYMDEDVEVLKGKLLAKGVPMNEIEDNSAMVSLHDTINCLTAIADRCHTINEVVSHIDELFADDEYIDDNGNKRKMPKNAIQLMTCHKSKGLESKRVFIICPDKLPMVYRHQLEWEYQQELNLQYVAYTRAKEELVIIDLCEEQIKGLTM